MLSESLLGKKVLAASTALPCTLLAIAIQCSCRTLGADVYPAVRPQAAAKRSWRTRCWAPPPPRARHLGAGTAARKKTSPAPPPPPTVASRSPAPRCATPPCTPSMAPLGMWRCCTAARTASGSPSSTRRGSAWRRGARRGTGRCCSGYAGGWGAAEGNGVGGWEVVENVGGEADTMGGGRGWIRCGAPTSAPSTAV